MSLLPDLSFKIAFRFSEEGIEVGQFSALPSFSGFDEFADRLTQVSSAMQESVRFQFGAAILNWPTSISEPLDNVTIILKKVNEFAVEKYDGVDEIECKMIS